MSKLDAAPCDGKTRITHASLAQLYCALRKLCIDPGENRVRIRGLEHTHNLRVAFDWAASFARAGWELIHVSFCFLPFSWELRRRTSIGPANALR